MITAAIVALVTPMHADGAVDFDSLAPGRLDVGQGTDAIVAVGHHRRSPRSRSTSTWRRSAAWSHARAAACGDRRHRRNSTKEAIAWTRAGKDAGADACLLVTPYYNKPPQEGLFRHYRRSLQPVTRSFCTTYPAVPVRPAAGDRCAARENQKYRRLERGQGRVAADP